MRYRAEEVRELLTLFEKKYPTLSEAHRLDELWDNPELIRLMAEAYLSNPTRRDVTATAPTVTATAPTVTPRTGFTVQSDGVEVWNVDELKCNSCEGTFYWPNGETPKYCPLCGVTQ
jgi:hypothetical protein